tara:strand:+ start:381 stop:1088 length:708 start_codon:yes stop_codon:yes gene_type:complete
MSKKSFVYCFSKKLAANEEQYAINLMLLEKSINHLKQFYSYRLITDQQTLEDVKSLSDNIEITSSDDYIFLEDIKTSLVGSLGKNELIIDPDLFVYKELDIPTGYDILFDHKDSPKRSWYTDYVEKLKGTLLYDKIKSAGKLKFVPNIGFFSINNPDLRSNFLEQYRYFRDDIIKNKKEDPNQFNLLLGQYLLGIVLSEGNYSYLNIRSKNSGDVYVHLAGPNKYKIFKETKSVI